MPALPRLEDGGEFRQLEHKRTPSLYLNIYPLPVSCPVSRFDCPGRIFTCPDPTLGGRHSRVLPPFHSQTCISRFEPLFWPDCSSLSGRPSVASLPPSAQLSLTQLPGLGTGPLHPQRLLLQSLPSPGRTFSPGRRASQSGPYLRLPVSIPSQLRRGQQSGRNRPPAAQMSLARRTSP